MIALETALGQLARKLLARSAKGPLDQILRVLPEHEPALAELLRSGIIRAFLQSARATAAPLAPQLPAIEPGGRPPRSPWGTVFESAGEEELPIGFPGIRAAAEWLSARQLMTPDDFKALNREAQEAAFTVARSATIDAVEKIRDAVAYDVREGGSLRQFREAVRDALDQSMLSPARVEALYRTHVGQATAAGQRAIIEHPLVADEFPYLLFTAAHDSRTRDTHRKMEEWGQDGTAVYRTDDPIWRTLWPPMEWNCRCNVIPLSIEDAARHGSREARRWLESGEPPASPDWARRPYPVTPPAGWPSHRGVAAVV